MIAENGWFAARPSGTEDIYKIYAESFRGPDHLRRIQEDARKIVALVKASGAKVQAAIQGEAVRITGKKRDDLQDCMQRIRTAGLGIPIQFQNFRD